MNDMADTPVIPATNKIAEALAKAAGGITNPVKNREVTVRSDKGSYKFKYATFDAILDAIRKPLSDNGLWFVQTLDGNQMVTTLYHSSGQTLMSRIPFVPGGNGPQAMGSALTYAKRYGLCALLGIAADEDDDANAAEGNDVTNKTEPKKAQPRTVSNDAPEPPPKDTDKGAAGAKPTIAERCKMKADALIAAIDAAPSFAEVNQLLAKEGLTNIDGMTWDLKEKSALEALMNNDFPQYERVVDAYNARQEKDIAE